MRPLNLGPRAYLGLCASLAACACTSPDFGPSIADARKVLDSSIEATKTPLTAAAARELRVAEAATLARNENIVALPEGCLNRINLDLALSVDHCRVLELAKPVSGPSNATQVLLAQTVMRDYFAVLADIAVTQSPAEIRAKSESLFSAFDDFAETQNGTAFSRLRSRADSAGPVASATLGFLAEQARIGTLRRIIRRADPVLEELVRDIQPILLDLGDPTAKHRADVVDAFFAYNDAVAAKDTARALSAAQAFKETVKRMHMSEATSALRQLYLVHDMHGAMLAALDSRASLAELNSLTAQISEIVDLLEDT